MVDFCARLARSKRFEWLILGVIIANAFALGLETYDGIDREIGGVLNALNTVFLGIFTVEIAIRLVGCGRHPASFFKSGWNVFDFVVVAAAYLPGVRENATLLRLVRLLRVFRLVSVLPDMRVLITGIYRSVRPLASLGVLTVLLLYIYGMLGWMAYGDHDPDRFGSIGQAMLTLFTVLTLEGWPEVLETQMELSDWSALYFVSFVILSSLILFNVVIGIVISSIEEARELVHKQDRETERRELEEAGGGLSVEEHLMAIRGALEGLEAEVRARDERSSARHPRERGPFLPLNGEHDRRPRPRDPRPHQALRRRHPRPRGIRPDDLRGLVLRPARTERRRQDHADQRRLQPPAHHLR